MRRHSACLKSRAARQRRMRAHSCARASHHCPRLRPRKGFDAPPAAGGRWARSRYEEAAEDKELEAKARAPGSFKTPPCAGVSRLGGEVIAGAPSLAEPCAARSRAHGHHAKCTGGRRSRAFPARCRTAFAASRRGRSTCRMMCAAESTGRNEAGPRCRRAAWRMQGASLRPNAKKKKSSCDTPQKFRQKTYGGAATASRRARCGSRRPARGFQCAMCARACCASHAPRLSLSFFLSLSLSQRDFGAHRSAGISKLTHAGACPREVDTHGPHTRMRCLCSGFLRAVCVQEPNEHVHIHRVVRQGALQGMNVCVCVCMHMCTYAHTYYNTYFIRPN